MFERYTETARRVIFFARSEAGQWGAHQIDAEHILLGIFRADMRLSQGLFRSPAAILATINKKLAEQTGTGEKVPISIDMPLSPEAKRVLGFAMEESDNLQHHRIGTEHLLLGIIKEGQSLARQVLVEHGISTEKILSYIKEKDSLPANSQADNPEFAQGISGGTIGGIAGGVPDTSAGLKQFAAKLIEHSELPQMQEQFKRLLDLLMQKGLITEDEKKDLL
jgi:ATP-dependent Clp protease ATP-binding subunit ClpC